ncbi:MAG TPA: hypothetical protein VF952_04410 [Chloroflexia bacterium]
MARRITFHVSRFRTSRRRQVSPALKRAFRLLRATSKLGVPGALPGPPQLLPAGARVLAQGYLNRFSMPLLREWLLPPWMRWQSDPSSPLFTPRSVVNLMVNQTARNWTALGIPGSDHPAESLVDKWGLLTPVPGGPSFDWWVDVEGGTGGTMSAATQPDVVQRLQGDLPVVLTAYEANGLRVSSEAWMLPLPEGDWAAMQVVLFNIADMRLKGTFSLALRPYNPEGISPIYNLVYDGATLLADGRPGPVTWPPPDGWALSGMDRGDLFNLGPVATSDASSLTDARGFAHGVLRYNFNIEPWEEAEFLAFSPVHKRQAVDRQRPAPRLFSVPQMEMKQPDSLYYSRAKASTTLAWRELLDGGMRVSLPHRDLQASWEANRAHLLTLHDGSVITPGPDLYHSFWLRDAAYMMHALSICGYGEAAARLVRGLLAWQRRNGAFVSHNGEWDGSGQALWAIERHLALHPNPALKQELLPAVKRARRWIMRMLAASEDGLMPPGISSEHLGPPDHYYWDSLWSLAGLVAADRLLGRRSSGYGRAASRLHDNIMKSIERDKDALGGYIVPAAPGRKIDLGMVGSLVGWFPLGLLQSSEDEPYGPSTLNALEAANFHEGALFVNTGHSGWGTYLNMRIVGCRLKMGLDGAWQLMKWLLDHASPTYNWPEAIHPHSKGGSAGDGHHGWASAEWLMLVQSMLFTASDDGVLVITPCLPLEWVQEPGRIEVERAPTVLGTLSYVVGWDAGGRNIRLDLSPEWHTPPSFTYWFLPGFPGYLGYPGKAARAIIDGRQERLTTHHVGVKGPVSTIEVIRDE